MIFYHLCRSVYSQVIYPICKLQYRKYLHLIQIFEEYSLQKAWKDMRPDTLAPVLQDFSQKSFSHILEHYPHSMESIFVGHCPIWMGKNSWKSLKWHFYTFLHKVVTYVSNVLVKKRQLHVNGSKHFFNQVLVLEISEFKFWYFVILRFNS